MQNLDMKEIQEDFKLFLQFPLLTLRNGNSWRSADYHNIWDNGLPTPIYYGTYLKYKKRLNAILNEIEFDLSNNRINLHEKIFAKRILYLFSTIDKKAFMKNESNSKGFFNIEEFEMPVNFFPLFIGIIGSLSKMEKTWAEQKLYAINLIDEFLQKDIQDLLYNSISKPNDIIPLYNYCLDFVLPDELYDYSVKLDNIAPKIISASPIERLNFTALKDKLYSPDAIFITRHYRRKFYSDISHALDLYNNFFDELITSNTKVSYESRNNMNNLAFFYKELAEKNRDFSNLLQNYDEKLSKWKTEDENIVLKLFFPISPSGN